MILQKLCRTYLLCGYRVSSLTQGLRWAFEECAPISPTHDVWISLCRGGEAQHELDYRVLEEARLPEGLTLVMGLIDTKTSIVETKELVAERLLRVASLVHPQQLIAGTDCGLATFDGSGYTHVAPAAVPLKLKALTEGANLALQRMGNGG
jgi:methionine synthase II (cobalamin-independent)